MDLSNKLGRREQGQRIQRAVERAGLSIEELAGRIGCSRALIYQYLAGSTLSQPDRLQQIAAECGVPLTYFYSDGVTGNSVALSTSDPTSISLPATLSGGALPSTRTVVAQAGIAGMAVSAPGGSLAAGDVIAYSCIAYW